MVTISTAWPSVFAAAAPAGMTTADSCRRFGAVFSSTCWEQVRAGSDRPVAQLRRDRRGVAGAPGHHGCSPSCGSAATPRTSIVGPRMAAPLPARPAAGPPASSSRPRSSRWSSSVRCDLSLRSTVPAPVAGAAPSYLPGVVASPSVLLTTLLLGLAAAALALRSWPRRMVSARPVSALVVMLLLPVVVHGRRADDSPLAAAVLVFLLVLVQPRRSTPAGLPAATMWGGRAPGVLLLLALAVAATPLLDRRSHHRGLAQRRPRSLGSPHRSDPTSGRSRCNPTSATCRGPHLSVAAPYVWAGLVAIPFVAVFLVGRARPLAVPRRPRGGGQGRPRKGGQPFAGVTLREGGSVDALRELEGLGAKGHELDR